MVVGLGKRKRNWEGRFVLDFALLEVVHVDVDTI